MERAVLFSLLRLRGFACLLDGGALVSVIAPAVDGAANTGDGINGAPNGETMTAVGYSGVTNAISAPYTVPNESLATSR